MMSLLVQLSCAKVDAIKAKIDKLDARILSIEEAVTSINDNAVAIANLMDGKIVISEFKELEHGYEMVLNNGQTIRVFFGAEMPGIVPIIGVNGRGEWIMSIDGGSTFSTIPKAAGPFSGAGVTPSVKIDSDGYWTISYDGGKTYERIVDGKGLPFSATDGRELAGGYAFFLNVTVDKANNLMTFHLVTGEDVTVPVNPSSDIILEGYTPKTKIFMGRTLSYKCTATNISSAVWTEIPEGWSAVFGTGEMSFTAPQTEEEGEYTFRLLTFSNAGLAKEFKYVFTFDNDIFFDDFSEGSIPNPQFWELCKRKYSTGYSMYMSESYDNTYLQDGKLVMVAEKVGDTYKSSGIQTRFGFEKCRIELNARFVKMAESGVVNAAWLFPFSRYIWPKGGEVDIFEHLNDADNLWCTCHTYYSVELGFDGDAKHKKVSINKNAFNTYGIDLTEEAVIFYINGNEVFRYGNKHLADEDEMWQYPFWKSDFYLLLDTCLGMEWPGPINDSTLPARMEVDWVKISKLD